MELSWLSVAGATGLAALGLLGLYISLLRSGDTLKANPEAVKRAVDQIDDERLSNSVGQPASPASPPS